MKAIVTILMCISVSVCLNAQRITGFSTEWDDSFSKWIIHTEEDRLQGEIGMRWAIRNDWSEWDYRVGEASGAIKVKWKNDLNLWELRGGNEIVTIRTVFKDDVRQWEIRSGNHTIDIKSKYGNVLEEWIVEDRELGNLYMYTTFEGDLRDWIIEDELLDAVSLHTRIAIAFIPILSSTPKI